MTYDLFSYPHRPGWKEPGTSREAAARIEPTASVLRDLVLETLAASPGGLTADEIAARLNRSILSVRPRVSELRADGKIMRAERRGKNASGMSAAVWIVSRETETALRDPIDEKDREDPVERS